VDIISLYKKNAQCAENALDAFPPRGKPVLMGWNAFPACCCQVQPTIQLTTALHCHVLHCPCPCKFRPIRRPPSLVRCVGPSSETRVVLSGSHFGDGASPLVNACHWPNKKARRHSRRLFELHHLALRPRGSLHNYLHDPIAL